MIKVKSKNQFGEEILVNTKHITHIIPAYGGTESIIFLANDTHIAVIEPFSEFRKLFCDYPYTSSKRESSTKEEMLNASKDGDPDLFAALPRLPNGNIDKRTTQYKEYMSTAHHPV